jgi:hypothetical protein
VMEMLKAGYGLKDAVLLWYLRLHFTLVNKAQFKQQHHDACVYHRFDKDNQIIAIVSLHVDDLLLAGSIGIYSELLEILEKEFGKLKTDMDKFRHFGVEIERLSCGSILMDQTEYVKQLCPVTVIAPRGSGRTATTDLNETEITDYRSLVSGISWWGITNPNAQAAASLYQGLLPTPTIEDARRLNACLADLVLHYAPFKIPTGIDYRNCHGKLTTDSSFNNTVDRKSQNCHHLLLCAGPGLSQRGELEFTKGFILSSKSGKSKRVCTSTMHAEALAMIGGTEDAEYFLSWLLDCNARTFRPGSLRTLRSMSGRHCSRSQIATTSTKCLSTQPRPCPQTSS